MLVLWYRIIPGSNWEKYSQEETAVLVCSCAEQPRSSSRRLTNRRRIATRVRKAQQSMTSPRALASARGPSQRMDVLVLIPDAAARMRTCWVGICVVSECSVRAHTSGRGGCASFNGKLGIRLSARDPPLRKQNCKKRQILRSAAGRSCVWMGDVPSSTARGTPDRQSRGPGAARGASPRLPRSYGSPCGGVPFPRRGGAGRRVGARPGRGCGA